MSILRLAAQLTLDGTRFKAGLREAQAASGQFAKNIGSSLKGQVAAAFGAGAILAFVKEAVTYTANLKDQAEQMHVTTDELQRLIAAGDAYGIKVQDLMTAERQFNQNRREAVEKSRELRAAFQRMGITLEDLQDGSFGLSQAMQKAGQAMSAMTLDEQRRALNDLADIFGTKVGPKLREFLKGLEETKNEPIVSQKAIDQLDKAIDKLSQILRIAKGITAVGVLEYLDMIGFGFGAQRGVPIVMEGAGKKMEKPPKIELPDTAPTYTAEEEEMLSGGKPPLFKKTIEQIEAEEAEKRAQEDVDKAGLKAVHDKLELEKAVFRVMLQQMGAADARLAKEEQLRRQLEAIQLAEEHGFDATKERMDALEMLEGLSKPKDAGRIDSSQLTKVGQLSTGRNVVIAEKDSELLAEARKILGMNTKQRDLLQKLEEKIRVTRIISST